MLPERAANACAPAPGPFIAPNKKVGSRPLERATYLEASQYKFDAVKTQVAVCGGAGQEI
jgi:hypothetical protein